MATVELDAVTKVYPNGVEAVQSVSLEIGDGELMVLVGPSGCGKTTVLRMVAGLEEISDGEVRIGGRVVNDVSPKDRDIAMVFQNYALYPHMTVAQNIGFGLKMRRLPRAEVELKVRNTAKMLGLEPVAGSEAGTALGRAATAGGHGARHRARAEGVPDGRAAEQPGRQAARADARRGLPDPAAAGSVDALRHP